MIKFITLFFLLIALADGAEIGHAVASVDVPGVWETDRESNDSTLILNSKPSGKQIVVTILDLKKDATALEQVVPIATKILKVRLASVQELSPDVQFGKADVSTTDSTFICVCRGFTEKDKVRMVIRIEGTLKTVRSTSVYDYTGPSAEEFQRWSNAILVGIK